MRVNGVFARLHTVAAPLRPRVAIMYLPRNPLGLVHMPAAEVVRGHALSPAIRHQAAVGTSTHKVHTVDDKSKQVQ